jgi:hypothetical protein
MNKEQQELLDEAYENYVKWVESSENQNNKNEIVKIPDSKETLIKTIKGDDEIVKKMGKRYCDEFSEKWGLKIEERELSRNERSDYYYKHGNSEGIVEGSLDRPIFEEDEVAHKWYDERNVPTKLITITYNDKTIESYES